MFLGIDVGTSEVKVLLLDAEHHVIGVTGSSLEVSRPHPGHSDKSLRVGGQLHNLHCCN